MRPFITFIGMILIIPGWTLLSVDASDTINPHFSTLSGTLLWRLLGNPHNIGFIHVCGLATIIFGIVIAIFGLIMTPEEKDTPESSTT